MNVKQGDLAIVVGLTKNTGKIVKVLNFLGSDPVHNKQRWNVGDGPCWLVESCGGPFAVNIGSAVQIAPCPDACLRPISGIPYEESADTNRPIKEPA